MAVSIHDGTQRCVRTCVRGALPPAAAAEAYRSTQPLGEDPVLTSDRFNRIGMETSPIRRSGSSGGDDSWGARTLDKYHLPAEGTLRFELSFQGI